jgi:hypothetical protein
MSDKALKQKNTFKDKSSVNKRYFSLKERIAELERKLAKITTNI